MVQLDGSHHDWFEGRRAKCVLRVMVDDATTRMRARFSEEETTRASYDVFEGWGRKHRLPGSLYVDRDSLYRCEGAASVADQLAGKERQTQFGRAMAVFRSASATLRPSCIPRPKPGTQTNNINQQKGTFSRKLSRGHF
jgi:hypothetical protein